MVIVLSQFWILTVCSEMSMTSPSAPNCGSSTQSPTRTMSVELSWIEATSDRIVSLKISSRTAVIAPMPVSICHGSSRITAEIRTTVPMTCTRILPICT